MRPPPRNNNNNNPYNNAGAEAAALPELMAEDLQADGLAVGHMGQLVFSRLAVPRNKALLQLALLEPFAHIRELDIAWQKSVVSLRGISALATLEVLNAEKCAIASIDDIEMPNIRVLRLSENSIRAFPDLRKLPLVQTLDLDNNRIDTIPAAPKGVLETTQLQVLSLRSNSLATIEGLKGLRLTELHVDNNRLTALDDDLALGSLKVLTAAGNQIASIHGLSSAPNLQILDLAQNSLAAYSSLAELRDLRYLWNLNVSGNPLVSTDQHRFETLALLERLRMLDNEPTSAEEKVKAVLAHEHKRLEAREQQAKARALPIQIRGISKEDAPRVIEHYLASPTVECFGLPDLHTGMRSNPTRRYLFTVEVSQEAWEREIATPGLALSRAQNRSQQQQQQRQQSTASLRDNNDNIRALEYDSEGSEVDETLVNVADRRGRGNTGASSRPVTRGSVRPASRGAAAGGAGNLSGMHVIEIPFVRLQGETESRPVNVDQTIWVNDAIRLLELPIKTISSYQWQTASIAAADALISAAVGNH